jgi:hypothetical protein
MRKREKRLTLSRETVGSLMKPLAAQELVEVLGGSCAPRGGSTAGGSAKICCIEEVAPVF